MYLESADAGTEEYTLRVNAQAKRLLLSWAGNFIWNTTDLE